MFLSISAAVTLAVLIWAGKVLLPFILAVIIAYVLTPLVAGAERLRVPRAAAILLVYFVTFGTLYVSVAAISPRVYVEGMKLLRDTPALASQLSQQWSPRIDAWFQGVMERAGYVEAESLPDTSAAIDVRPEPDGSFRIRMGTGVDVVQHGPGHWRIGPAIPRSSSRLNVSQLTSQGIDEFINYAKRNAMALVRFGHTLVSEIARGVFLLFMTLMVAGYLMHTRESVLGFFRSLVPMRARIGFDRLVWRIDRGLAGVVRGQLLICAVNGVFSAIGFWMFDLKYWPILAIVAAVMSIVPIFGSILSSIPAVMIGLTQGFWTALWVLLWIIGIHQIEANLLNPKIIGVAAKIHPVLVVMALLIGEHFYGLWGALLAVPALSLAQSIFNHFRFESMPDVPPDSFLPPAGVGRLP
ncbi:MAG TPA: AI-2E family transporter [Polyangiaceae bacterium]|nr:AI-2E family transporter [Polyangiaceae bacterium]